MLTVTNTLSQCQNIACSYNSFFGCAARTNVDITRVACLLNYVFLLVERQIACRSNRSMDDLRNEKNLFTTW